MFAILTHFSPLLTTLRAKRQQKLITFFAHPPPAKITRSQMSRFHLVALLLVAAAFSVATTNGQTADDTIRVTVSVNADGSKTTYQYDNAKHQATATTTDSGGNVQGKVVYRIDDAGRFGSGVTFGPNGKFLFKSIYKYDAAGRLEQESRLDRDDSVLNKIVYEYSPAGKQIGYSIYDPSGKLISGSHSSASTPPPKSRKPLSR